jgi:predicted DCC family thiol-disulfide oxidoreductase YuxK
MSNESTPDKQVVVFDGVCMLCSRWVRFVIKHDRRRLFVFAAMQSASGRELLTRHGMNPDDPLSLLLVDAQHSYSDTDAIIRIVTQFGGLWRSTVMIRAIPRRVRDVAYRYLARNRYRWFGRHAVCMMPSADKADRFLQ